MWGGPARPRVRLGPIAARLRAGGWLVVGAMAAASLQTLVPRDLLDAVAGNHLLAVLGLGLTDAALASVRGALRPPLVVSGVVLLVLAGPGPGRPLRAQHPRPVWTPSCIELQLHC
jgi:hypothetical protein